MASSSGALQHDLAAGALEAGLVHHRHRRHRRVAIEPLADGAGRTVEHHAETAERPAVVGHRNEEAGGQPVEDADLAADQRHLAAEAHRAHAKRVHRPHDVGFEPGQPLVAVHIVERAKQLLLGFDVAAGAIAADADANRARPTPLALRLPDRVQQALADAVHRAIGASEVRQFHRQRVLHVHVLAAAALQNQLHLDRVALPLFEVQDRRAGAEVVAGVLAGQGIHGVRPQLAEARGFSYRGLDLLLHPDLVGADRRLDLESRHAGVLADGALALCRLVDVLRDDGQRLGGAGAGLFRGAGALHRGSDIGRKIGGGLDNQLQDRIEKLREHNLVSLTPQLARVEGRSRELPPARRRSTHP